jgi:glycosyltransferase involved in cell wall biosynthesis
MGNIGFSQGLAPLVAAFERSQAVKDANVKLVIPGSGVAADEVRAEIRSDSVEMPGVVDDDRLERELVGAAIGLVTQHHEGGEFNIPSKLMNLMMYGLPVVAAVNPSSEVARIVDESGGGWVVDSSRPDDLPAKLAEVVARPEDLQRRATAARAYAQRNFTREEFARRFLGVLQEVSTTSR